MNASKSLTAPGDTGSTGKTGRLLRTLALSALSLLNACAIQAPLEIDSYAEHQARLAAIDNWRVKGKIGLRHDERGGSAALNWEQHGARYSVHLHGPLGIGSVSIEGDGQQVQLRNQQGEYVADNAEALIEQMTGWQIPVSALRFWAKGMPDPELPIIEQQVIDARLKTLRQGGWSIEYRDFKQVDAVWLPGRVVMARPRTRLTIIQKHWDIL